MLEAAGVRKVENEHHSRTIQEGGVFTHRGHQTKHGSSYSLAGLHLTFLIILNSGEATFYHTPVPLFKRHSRFNYGSLHRVEGRKTTAYLHHGDCGDDVLISKISN